MANTPTAGFEHAWRSLMTALGKTHPTRLRVNKVLIRALHNRMGIR